MATTTNFGWETPDDTDLVKDGAAAIRTALGGVDTSFVDLKGGTTGQVLSKASNTDLDYTWVTTDDANAIQNAIVDAKGDLIAASAADTPARLAVGNNGETLVADSSQAVGLRYNPQNALANPVINGGMDIWQRGTSFSYAGGVPYNADRWFLYRESTGVTISRQLTSDTTNLANVQYCNRVQRDSGNTSTNSIYLAQSFETVNSRPFSGKTVTMSFYARAGANYSSASSILIAGIDTGTGTDQNNILSYTGYASAGSTNATLTTTWQRFVVTGTIPTTATEIGLRFYYTPVGTAGANDYFEITGAQIDLGTYTASTAPSFRRSGGTLQGELAACQRYYWRTTGSINQALGFSAINYSTTGAICTLPLKVTMRVAPTVLDYSNVQIYDSVSNFAITGLALWAAATTETGGLLATGASGMTTYRPGILTASATTGYIGLSAEL